MIVNELDKDELNRHFQYCDGKLYWKIRKQGRQMGKPVGSLVELPSGYKYYQVSFKYKLYRLHHIIWVMHNGHIPEGFIVDHINCDSLDNRIENLRLARLHQNSSNTRLSKANKSGVKGVSWSYPAKKWRCNIDHKGKRYHVGYYKTLEEAKEAIEKKRTELHREFARFE